LKNEDSEDEFEFWVFSTMEEKERAEQIQAQVGSWEEFWDQLCKEKIYAARLWLRDRRAIFYHQHSQPQGYPVIRWLEEKLGIEVQPYDGGHTDHWPSSTISTRNLRAIPSSGGWKRNSASKCSPMMEAILITMRNGKRTMPKFDVIHLEVSGQCQLNCPYCYSESGTELAVGEWQSLMEELAPLTRQFTLGGGEPLLYDGLGDIVETIHRLGLPVSLTTNGLLLGAKGDLVSALDAVSVSYHGDLEVLREGLALLERMGIQRMVNFIMLDQDKPRFGAILEACKTFGAALVLLAPKHRR